MNRILQILQVILILNFSCQPTKEEKVIKTITTTFISHQIDTEQKDDKVVAVANFNIDGSLNEFTQHSTYPYDYVEPKTRNFWQSPIQENVSVIMDGLELSHAEKNFLYGNDWPKAYAAMIEKDGHPKYPKSREIYNTFKTVISYESDTMPSMINTKTVIDEEKYKNIEPYPSTGYLEKFIFENNHVTKYGTKYLTNSTFITKMLNALPKVDKEKLRSEAFADSIFQYINFEYKDDLLISVTERNKNHKFIYENGVLVKSEYYLNDQIYNQRYFYYNEDGSKNRTELFNFDNDPEYTITYKYDYFESQF